MGLKLRQYEELWLNIATSSAPVAVICHERMSKRLIQAVRKEKTRQNVSRKLLDLPSYGKLLTTTEHVSDSKVKLLFSLEYNGDFL